MSTASEPRQLSVSKCYGGSLYKFAHQSTSLGCEMKFSAFVPAGQAAAYPALFFLSGLTCNEDNFITKAGAIRKASELGLILVCPDTSPRGLNIEGEEDGWDFGTGAGFYVNATEAKWKNYQMDSYVNRELFEVLPKVLPIDLARVSIFGHSMGGHGALVSFLRNLGKYRSVSAFSPICNPVECPWGVKAFTGYLGSSVESWKQYDATELVKTYRGPKIEILVDQGSADSFLDNQLRPESLLKAASENPSHVQVNYRLQPGYDHSYWFIQTFVDDHLEFHAKALFVNQ
ncbi:Alpha/Beta hydrolase protein [Polychytrium aggregatum]|uniref:Alpha/Beta hydrolase protein n=1 Tax=Polychytrium aggregatum TaxID=110093 RepID=UPI0022FE43C3|nr:Alpha/Beta hydrolase protein [Polychytrium aggregatum]KAI9199791.1 Alpha/Beta hydrolase protein [Polychytrium aggregatum]